MLVWLAVRQAMRNRGFVACAALLLVFAGSFHLIAIVKGYNFMKESVPLRKALSQLRRDRLLPYEWKDTREIPPESITALGTDQYVQWIMSEPDQPGGPGSGRAISLFVTYYTGLPDAVPHVPETCYVGAGYEVANQVSDEIAVISQGQEIVVPIQVLEFQKKGNSRPLIVLYTFHSNGKFREDRTAVRMAIGSLTDRFAYFSKLEVNIGLEPGRFGKEQAVAAAKRFLQVAIPVLLEDHWPDWEAFTKQAATRPAAGKDK